MAISENPSADEIAAALRRRAAIWAHEYYSEETAEWFADWYAVNQPPLTFVAAFKEFQAWQADTAARMYGA